MTTKTKYCEADTQYSSHQSLVAKLTEDLTRSLRRPGRKTLALIDKALSYLTPFESAKASVVSVSEKQELLELLNAHRLCLSPYLDLDRIESNLRKD